MNRSIWVRVGSLSLAAFLLCTSPSSVGATKSASIIGGGSSAACGNAKGAVRTCSADVCQLFGCNPNKLCPGSYQKLSTKTGDFKKGNDPDKCTAGIGYTTCNDLGGTKLVGCNTKTANF